MNDMSTSEYIKLAIHSGAWQRFWVEAHLRLSKGVLEEENKRLKQQMGAYA